MNKKRKKTLVITLDIYTSGNATVNYNIKENEKNGERFKCSAIVFLVFRCLTCN